VGAHGVPAAARSAVMAFIADTFAVGIAGLAAPWRGEILDLLFGAGGAAESTVFGSGERLPLMHAAMLNAYQNHAQEFDCVHERAVVHPMAAVLPALLGWAKRDGGISGALLIRATVVAIDVAATLGLCSRAPRSAASSAILPSSKAWPTRLLSTSSAIPGASSSSATSLFRAAAPPMAA